MLRDMLIDVFKWLLINAVLDIAFSAALGMLFRDFHLTGEGGGDDEGASCGWRGDSFYSRSFRLAIAVLGGGEEFIICFRYTLDDKLASYLVLVYIVLTAVMLMNST